MKSATLTAIVCLSLLTGGCANDRNQQATLVAMEGNKSVYSTSGLVLLSNPTKGATKPFAERGLSAACPAGLEYRRYTETVNRVTIVGTWLMWEGLVACK